MKKSLGKYVNQYTSQELIVTTGKAIQGIVGYKSPVSIVVIATSHAFDVTRKQAAQTLKKLRVIA